MTGPDDRPLRVGIDLGGTKTEILVLDADGEAIHRARRATVPNYEGTVRGIVAIVAETEAALGRRFERIGVGMPGGLDRLTGVARNANSTWLNGRRFGHDLEAALGRPVRCENDANCLAVSEAADGAGAGAFLVFAAILGTGIGAGLAVGGRAHSGPNGIAGEWGHNPLPWPRDNERPGPACYCGRFACLETFISGPAFVADAARDAADPPRTAQDVVRRARAGDAAMTAALERWLDRTARGLAHVVNVLDPDVIVLGGGLSNIEGLPESLPALMAPWVFTGRFETPIRRSAHGDSSGVRGAAWLWDVEAA